MHASPMEISNKIHPIPLLLAEQELELKRGYQLGIYTFLEQIGYGGESVVWSGFDNLRKQIVAIKIIATDISDPVVASLIPTNFEREVHLVASLEHPHIVPIYEFGMAETFSYFVMQYKCCGTVADWIKTGPMPLVEVVHIAKQILTALSYLHVRDIVHRDIKPSNILLDSQMRVYLADFGLAKKFSQSTMLLHTGRGTGPYASYEQQASFGVTQQSDIYSLGIVIYEMLAGKLPWDGQYTLASLQNKENAVLPDPCERNRDCTAELTAVLRQLTHFRWQDRPQTAEEAYALLYAALPAIVQREVGQLLKPVQLMEKKFLAQDAAYLLDMYQSDWLEEEKYPVGLTHFAFMEAHYHGLSTDVEDETKQFLLRGALTHDYQLNHWWGLLANPQLRWQVSEAILTAENEDVVARFLPLFLQEPAGGMVTAVFLEKLIDLATKAKEWRLRRDALIVVKHLLPDVADWQTLGISEVGDVRLAQLAIEGSAQGKQAVEIIGMLQSETAVEALVDAYKSGSASHVLRILQQLQEAVGSLPLTLPPSIRFQLWAKSLQAVLLHDQEGLSLSRSLIGLAVGILVSLLFVLGYFSQIVGQMQDFLLLPYPVSDVVTIVEVDDDTLAQYGRWAQWSRSLHAELITKLQEVGAKTIVFDFVFESETDEDTVLAEAMQAAGNVIQPILVQGDAFHDLEGMLRYESRILPQPTLLAASAAVGHTSILHDEDGYIRRVPTVISIDGQQYDSLAMVALSNFLGSENSEQAVVENGCLSFAGRQIPVEEDGEMHVYYAGPPAQPEQTTFSMVQYQDVLAGTIPAELLRDKIVLVGITATAEPDRYLTPVSHGRPMYGVEILANVIESIWSDRFIRTPGTAVTVAILLVMGLLVGWVCTRPLTGLLFALIIAGLYFLAAGWIFDAMGIMLDLFFPFLTIALSTMMVTVYRFSVELRRRYEIINLFAGSVTPSMAQATIEAVKRGEINLNGQEQELSVLLIEMRGQIDYANHHDPKDVLAMMTFFRNKAIQTVLGFEGTIIHSEQGQTMAVFNAPLTQSDHVWRAVQAAQSLQTENERYCQSLPEGHPHREIVFAYVVNTGRAVIGYAGEVGQNRFTILGEAVNLAGHMVSKATAGQVLLGEQSYEQTADRITAIPLTPIRVGDRVTAVPIFAIIKRASEENRC